MLKNKKVIAVSGGVDSMFLLNQLKDENVIVAYVNYNKRKDAFLDQEIVSKFCISNNLKLEILSLSEIHNGNFQKWARNKRYKFFKEIYDKYNCVELIIAQHKDDFIENAIMQWKSKRNPYFFGINKTNNVFNMNISRPMIYKYWKLEIYEFANNNAIPYNDDCTNFTNDYTRNQIRAIFSDKPLIIKEILLKSFKVINIEKSLQKIKIIKKYYCWSKTSFNINFLLENDSYAIDLIFKYIIENFKEKDIKISKNIINSIYRFLISQNGNKSFVLSGNQKISKFNNNVINE